MFKFIKTLILLAIIVYGMVNLVMYISFEMKFGSFKEEVKNEIIPFSFKDNEESLKDKIFESAKKNDIILNYDSLRIETNENNKIRMHAGIVDTFYLWFDFYYFPIYKSIDLEQIKSF